MAKPNPSYPPSKLAFSIPEFSLYQVSLTPSKYMKNAFLYSQDCPLIHGGRNTMEFFELEGLLRKKYIKNTSSIAHLDRRCAPIYPKTLKRVTLVGRCPIKHQIPYLTRLTIVEIREEEIADKSCDLRRTIVTCKRLKSLVIDQPPSFRLLKSIRYKRSLRDLILVVNESQIFKGYVDLSYLIELEKLSVLIKEDHSFDLNKNLIPALKTFIEKTFALKKLKYLKIHMFDRLHSYFDVTSTLFACITKSQIPSYNLQMKITDNRFAIDESVVQILNQLDCLAFHAYPEDVCGFFVREFDIYRPVRQLSSDIQWSRKTLVILDAVDKNIFAAFKPSNSLKVLYILMHSAVKHLSKLEDFTWLSGIKHFAVDFNFLHQSELLPTLGLLAHMLMNMPQLERLTLYDSGFSSYSEEIGSTQLQPIIQIFSHLENLTGLYIENIDRSTLSWQMTSKLITCVKKLEDLSLSSKGSENYNPFDYYFPFDELSGLRKLKLMTPSLVAKDCITYFVDNVDKLCNLEEIMLVEGSLEGIGLELLLIFIEKICTLEKMKDVSIGAALVVDNLDQIGSYFQDAIKKSIGIKLKRQVEKFFDMNQNLNKVHVYQRNLYNIKYVR